MTRFESANGGRVYVEFTQVSYTRKFADACSSFVELKYKVSHSLKL